MSPSERRLALRCCFLLVQGALALRRQPLTQLVAAIDRRAAGQNRCDSTPQEALRLLDGVARRLLWPRPSCLLSALAGYELLRERGRPASFVIGGLTTVEGFKAHAWLEDDGTVVLGAEREPYQRIWQWPGDPDAERRQGR